MRFPASRLLPTVLAAAILVPGPHAQAAQAPVTAKSFALTKADVPQGFKLTSGKFQPPSVAAGQHLKPAVLLGHGFLQSYLAQFQKGGTSIIASNSFLFRTAAGAAWYDHFEATVDVKASHVKTLPAPHLGDPSVAFTITAKAGNTSMVFYIVSVRHGRMYGGVGVGGPKGGVQLSDAVGLARKMQRRMHAAG